MESKCSNFFAELNSVNHRKANNKSMDVEH